MDRGDMTDSAETKLDAGPRVRWDFTYAFLILRVWLAVRALFIGIEKYSAYRSVAMPLIDRISTGIGVRSDEVRTRRTGRFKAPRA